MMETFLVLGLCFILYEALDFFQGCIHSNTPSPSDQIEAYRRELDEQRQQQQQEQFLAGLTPLLGAQFAAAAAAAAGAGSQSSSSTTTPTASTASVISDSYEQESNNSSQQVQQQQPHSLSTPGLYRQGYYDPEDPLHATSSLPRDYYYLQQQQLKNKASSKSLLSKFSSTNSDNRIYPEAGAGPSSVLGVITAQPLPVGEAVASLYDPPGPLLPTSSPLLLELKRAIISHHIDEDEELNGDICHDSGEEEEEEDDQEEEQQTDLSATSEPNICTRIHHIAIDDAPAISNGGFLASSSHADFREIECERLRRKCVSVKRIYSISEKF